MFLLLSLPLLLPLPMSLPLFLARWSRGLRSDRDLLENSMAFDLGLEKTSTSAEVDELISRLDTWTLVMITEYMDHSLVILRRTHRVPFNFTPMGASSSSFGPPHVRCTPVGVHLTCGEPNEIKKNTHPKNIAVPLR